MAWEVEAALRKMKNGKEAGKDHVNIETLKARGQFHSDSRYIFCQVVTLNLIYYLTGLDVKRIKSILLVLR